MVINSRFIRRRKHANREGKFVCGTSFERKI